MIDEYRLLRERYLPRVVAPALHVAKRAPKKDGRVDLTFARHGFAVRAVVVGAALEPAAAEVVSVLAPELGTAGNYVLSVWVPDSTMGNPLAPRAAALADLVETELTTRGARRIAARSVGAEPVPLADVCILGPDSVAVG